VYRGGIVCFRLPADWVEEYDESGGGTFYKPVENSGTLHLTVLLLEEPAGKPVNNGSAADALAGSAEKHGVPVVPMRDGFAMISYDAQTEDKGRSLKCRHWLIAQCLPPKNVRVAIFTYTLLAKQFDDPSSAPELAWIAREIGLADFASEVGEIMPPEKPWWRPW
jgi:hypothetical protein